ncbi:MAG: hypothetical protein KZQ88_12265 [Candidatus Thiodiazotropha sp. (ex Dulcina madagascariensis)]|nr:hypothetical protein [Candidatus Thiodiazotropha sp. (ex Dulcina madagascariensis)]MCU7928577.1 hypothetical protein [Candidatus Thiodiazotropha sp. (ex Dulcina madagascariensis)]
MTRLLREIRALPDQSLVLLGVYFRDADDHFFPARKSAKMIADASAAPVYGLLDFYLGYGQTGGKLISGYHQGQEAAKIAERILDGENAANIPVQLQGSNRNMFDHRVEYRPKSPACR